MEDIIEVELMVKSEKESDSVDGSDPTYLKEKFALYARYSFAFSGQYYNETVFITYLFESKKVIETGITTINEFKKIEDVSEEDINNAIKEDKTIKIKNYCGENLVLNKINSILHCDTLPYPISYGREKEYTILNKEG